MADGGGPEASWKHELGSSLDVVTRLGGWRAAVLLDLRTRGGVKFGLLRFQGSRTQEFDEWIPFASGRLLEANASKFVFRDGQDRKRLSPGTLVRALSARAYASSYLPAVVVGRTPSASDSSITECYDVIFLPSVFWDLDVAVEQSDKPIQPRLDPEDPKSILAAYGLEEGSEVVSLSSALVKPLEMDDTPLRMRGPSLVLHGGDVRPPAWLQHGLTSGSGPMLPLPFWGALVPILKAMRLRTPRQTEFAPAGEEDSSQRLVLTLPDAIISSVYHSTDPRVLSGGRAGLALALKEQDWFGMYLPLHGAIPPTGQFASILGRERLGAFCGFLEKEWGRSPGAADVKWGVEGMDVVLRCAEELYGRPIHVLSMACTHRGSEWADKIHQLRDSASDVTATVRFAQDEVSPDLRVAIPPPPGNRLDSVHLSEAFFSELESAVGLWSQCSGDTYMDVSADAFAAVDASPLWSVQVVSEGDRLLKGVSPIRVLYVGSGRFLPLLPVKAAEMAANRSASLSPLNAAGEVIAGRPELAVSSSVAWRGASGRLSAVTSTGAAAAAKVQTRVKRDRQLSSKAATPLDHVETDLLSSMRSQTREEWAEAPSTSAKAMLYTRSVVCLGCYLQAWITASHQETLERERVRREEMERFRDQAQEAAKAKPPKATDHASASRGGCCSSDNPCIPS
jgi:hypothetical protein